MSATVYDARVCALGEGPLWHPQRGQLFWFDILGKRLLSRAGGAPLSWAFDEHVSAAGWIDAETLLIASQSALLRFDIDSGEHETVLPLEPGKADTRSNDGRADPCGGFWIGTMALDAAPGAGALYRYYRGALETVIPEMTIPNAICFAPDGTRAYYADTARQQIMSLPLDAEGWPDGPAQVFVNLTAEGLNPDGAIVDSAGGLWNAQWGAGRVARYLPDGGFDRAVALPGRQASCPALGGPELKTLFVTSAAQGLPNADGLQGVTFETPVTVAGQAESRVILA